MTENFDLTWMDEPIEEIPGKQGLYKLFCTILFKRRMTYSNMYLLSFYLHKNKFKDNELALKEKILKDLALIYYFNNQKLPDGFTIDT